MALGRTRESAMATKHPMRYRIPVALAGVALNAAAFGVGSASATLLEEVAGAAKSVAPPVTVPAAPSLPSTAPPSTPPAPVAAPVAPQAPAKLPTSVTQTSSPSSTEVSSPVADVPSAGGVTGAPKKATSPTGSGEALARQSGHGASASTSEVGTAGGAALTSGRAPRKPSAPSAPPSIRSAEVAPLRRWLARVWPAIELGRGEAVLAKWEDTRTRPLTVFDPPRLFLLGIARASGDPTPSEHSATPNDPLAGPNSAPVLAGREITLFVIFSFAALLALLVSTVWAELRARYR
jgi:hypothetical protein